jgi:hypothetical protein
VELITREIEAMILALYSQESLLGIVLRSLIRLGTPHQFQGRKPLLVHALSSILSSMRDLNRSLFGQLGSFNHDPRGTQPLC